jgi:hypothetical protein
MLIFISYNRFGPFRLLQWLQQRRKKKRTQGARGARVGACPTGPSPVLLLLLSPFSPSKNTKKKRKPVRHAMRAWTHSLYEGKESSRGLVRKMRILERFPAKKKLGPWCPVLLRCVQDMHPSSSSLCMLIVCRFIAVDRQRLCTSQAEWL